MPRKGQPSFVYLEPNELKHLLDVAKEHSLRSWTMLLLAYRHALRASEVCGLRLQDVDTSEWTIRIRRLKGSASHTQQLLPHRGEPLYDEIRALREYLKERRTDAGDSLFPSQKGGKLDRRGFYKLYRMLAERAGLEKAKCHPHTLKHTACTHLLMGGDDVARVQKFVGHTAIQSTLRYTHINDADACKSAHNAFMNVL